MIQRLKWTLYLNIGTYQVQEISNNLSTIDEHSLALSPLISCHAITPKHMWWSGFISIFQHFFFFFFCLSSFLWWFGSRRDWKTGLCLGSWLEPKWALGPLAWRVFRTGRHGLTPILVIVCAQACGLTQPWLLSIFY